MAGPGDNTRNKPKNGSDTDAFKRAVTVCMRARPEEIPAWFVEELARS